MTGRGCLAAGEPRRAAAGRQSSRPPQPADAKGMMLLQRSRFLHLPKTGGTWVRHALLAGCPGARWCLLDGSDHLRWWEAPGAGRFTAAFVRHPLTWWQSFWRYHRGPARQYVVSQRICKACWSDDFPTFVQNVAERLPGEYGMMLENYVGPIGGAVHFLGRQEHLVDDLLLALQLADEPHDPAAIRAVAEANASDPATVAEYTPAAREAVLRTESGVLRRCGYDGLPPADPAMAQAWLARAAAPPVLLPRPALEAPAEPAPR